MPRPNLHPVLLTFRTQEMESEFERFCLEKNLFAWRRTVYLIFAAATCLYAYVMIRSPKDGRQWEELYSPAAKAGTTDATIGSLCPAGWFCMECNPDYICNTYHVERDLAFWLCTVLFPSLALIILSYKLRPVQLARSINLLSALFIVSCAAGGLILRYLVMEPVTPVFQPALIGIMLIFVAYMFMRLRFIYTLVSIIFIVLLFIAGYAPHVAHDSPLSPSTAKTYVISVLALVVSAVVVSFQTYETEVYYRSQFLAAYNLQKANAKLINQLKVLQKAYGKKVADLDSPLEKSVMLIRSMMADPSNTPSHLMTLGQVMTLLGSSNLLAPDLENQVQDLDNEQEKWLFSEIQPRRKGSSRPRHGSRRRSVTGDISAKIDRPIAEAISHASIMGNNNGSVSHNGSVQNNIGVLSQISGINHNGSGMATSGPLSITQPGGSAPDLESGDRIADSTHSVVSMNSPTGNRYTSLPMLIGASGTFVDASDVLFNPSHEAMAMLGRSNEYDWPLFDFADAVGGRPLSVLSIYLFRRADLFTAFNIPVDLFRNFIVAIENGYRKDLPYHNSTHASDVLHCINYFVHSNDNLSRVAGDIDLLSMYLAAIIHDYDHPGLNNNFLVNTSDAKALMYNDRSVLENHHLSAAFGVLSRPENNFLVNLPKSEFRTVRDSVIDMVLATDLSQHFPLISQFKSKVSSTFAPDEQREDRHLLWKILIKCADVSNPTKSWPIYERWVRVILEEFFRQGDLEKRLGLQVSPYMDRDSLNIPSSQSGFIEFVVSPLFEAYDKWAPMPAVMTELQRNREFWIRLKAQGLTNTMPLTGPLGSQSNLSAYHRSHHPSTSTPAIPPPPSNATSTANANASSSNPPSNPTTTTTPSPPTTTTVNPSHSHSQAALPSGPPSTTGATTGATTQPHMAQSHPHLVVQTRPTSVGGVVGGHHQPASAGPMATNPSPSHHLRSDGNVAT
ncbi:High affinity cAMP-specific 3',5'-cyclic phosphodiesterase 7A, partial [Thoreauomyces humboldtii]